MLGNLILPEIREFLETRNLRELKDTLAELPDVDVADLIDDLGPEEKGAVFRLLAEDQAIEVFEELSIDSQIALIQSLANEKLAALLDEMAPDERTHLLEDLPPKITRRLIGLLSPEERRVATNLLGYPEDSAGRLMTPDLVWIKEDATASQTLEKIRGIAVEAETINLIYVVDGDHCPLGVVTLADLVLAADSRPVRELMDSSLVTVTVSTDREEAAALCNKYGILALPVTSENSRLVGIVTVDDLVEVIEEEATEDIHLMAGVAPPEKSYLELRIGELWWRRVVWLLALVLIEIGAGYVLRANVAMLENFVTLAVFLTVMTATGGSCGTQSATMVIRALATGDLEFSDFKRVLWRETAVGLLLGCGAGVFVFGLACVVQGAQFDLAVALTIGLTLGLLLMASNLIGALLPMGFSRMGLDPALMAGPFITTLVDIIGLLLYFQIARMLLFPMLGA